MFYFMFSFGYSCFLLIFVRQSRGSFSLLLAFIFNLSPYFSHLNISNMLAEIQAIEDALLQAEIKIRENGNAYQIKALYEFKAKYRDLQFRRNVNVLLNMGQ